MKIGIVISQNRPETVWNALRIANFSRNMQDEVRVFLIGEGVEAEVVDIVEEFRIGEQLQAFTAGGGKIWACSTCLSLRQLQVSDHIQHGTLSELYEIIRQSDKLLTF